MLVSVWAPYDAFLSSMPVAILMAFRWWADSGSRLYACWLLLGEVCHNITLKVPTV